MAIRKAEKQQAKLRLALVGPTGSGKTFSGLAIASGLGGKVGVIDTERNSACLYSDKFEFDVEADMGRFSPEHYIQKIHEFAKLGYDVLMIDSLSHAWSGQGGALEMVDEAAKRNKTGNSFAGWREVTPLHNKMVEAILGYPGHVIVTMRSKMEYVQEKDQRGKTVIRKVGMQPVQRDGLEYEFTVVGDMDTDHNLVVTKSRCSALADQVIRHPGAELAETLLKWLNDGTAAPERQRTIAPADGVPRGPVASEEQVKRLLALLQAVEDQIKPTTVNSWLAKAGVGSFDEMPAEVIAKCIAFCESKLPAEVGAL